MKNILGLQEYRRIYYQKNKEKIKGKVRLWIKNKIKEDLDFAIRTRLRRRLSYAINLYLKERRYLKSRDFHLDYENIIHHLKPFPKYIKDYHIDHIIPLCSFDLTKKEEILKAFAPENHQWLLIKENLVKGGKIDYEK